MIQKPEKTLYEKMLDAIYYHIHLNGNGVDESNCAKACEVIAKQAQLDIINHMLIVPDNLKTLIIKRGKEHLEKELTPQS